MRFPEKGTLLTPEFPGPTNARTFVILRLLGVLAGVVAKAVDGRMPADQETIRYTGVYGKDRDGKDYLMREVLGGDRADATTPMAKTQSMSSRILGTCRRNSRSPASPSVSSGSDWLSTRAVQAATVGASATKSTFGCSRTLTSCRSPTARSWPAGVSREERQADRSK